VKNLYQAKQETHMNKKLNTRFNTSGLILTKEELIK
jgi:hypothetical protein